METTKDLEIMIGCDRGLCHQAVGRQDKQLNTYDWLADVPGNTDTTDLVEVQFKHTRKGYYHNVNNLELKKGDKWRQIMTDSSEQCPEWSRHDEKIYVVTKVNRKTYSCDVYTPSGELSHGCKVYKEGLTFGKPLKNAWGQVWENELLEAPTTRTGVA